MLVLVNCICYFHIEQRHCICYEWLMAMTDPDSIPAYKRQLQNPDSVPLSS